MADVDPTDLTFWQSVDWQTIVTLLSIIIPVLIGVTWGLFKLVASHAREALAAERKAHEDAKSEIARLKAKVRNLRQAVSRLTKEDVNEIHQIELSSDEQRLLSAISQEMIGPFLRSTPISIERIRLAEHRLFGNRLIDRGTDGLYATGKGLEWLDAHRLID